MMVPQNFQGMEQPFLVLGLRDLLAQGMFWVLMLAHFWILSQYRAFLSQIISVLCFIAGLEQKVPDAHQSGSAEL